MSNSSGLRKVLRSWDVVGLAVGTAIGAGIFRISQSIAEILPYPGLILLCWVMGGVIALSGALVYGELARRYPDVGGDYTYLKNGLGEGVAFLFAWTKVFIVQPASIAVIAFIFAAYFQTFFPIEGLQVQTIAILGILFLAILNMLGVRKGVFFQNLTTFLKVASIAFIAISAFCVPAKGIVNFQPLFPEALELPLIQAVGLSLMFILWTFGGWNEGVFLAGEMKRPKEELPKGLFLGTLLIAFTYLLINAAYHYHLPINEIAKNETPAALLVSILFGPQASRWLALLIALSTFGALNSLILTGGRVGYAFAQDHRWFSYLARISPRFQTPANGIFLIVLISTLMVFSATFEKLVGNL